MRSPETPAPLHAAFDELAEAIRPHAGNDDVGLLTETFWAALHGLTMLARGGRIPSSHRQHRLELLLAHFTR
ncbi:WHG domain-containing protein [Amycolatopsis taiwanensis]|uniref:WHG domain-containing protein n=1 Tax=Amycolatopsis taiwanensis TaxID=342230 RepID=UPI000488D34A|nr:WHG domain-containing protein [Amycolatopsis taiwanensis]